MMPPDRISNIFYIHFFNIHNEMLNIGGVVNVKDILALAFACCRAEAIAKALNQTEC